MQDTGPDGAAWALAVRGGPSTLDDLVLAWTLRGAPHAYRRADLRAVAAATAPFSDADAAKRVFDASKPLSTAGIAVLDALKVVAGHMRDMVSTPTVKGDVSGELSERLDEPYLRYSRPCSAIHLYEQPFRLAALQAGLELEPGTSPPVLRRIPRMRAPNYAHLAAEAEDRLDRTAGRAPRRPPRRDARRHHRGLSRARAECTDSVHSARGSAVACGGRSFR
ncbi:MAG: hypothetical protein JJE52_08535 [Acidimicrobiia bacterium]|nr:hypothetical protein [Acidimicrobiia bacterium]